MSKPSFIMETETIPCEREELLVDLAPVQSEPAFITDERAPEVARRDAATGEIGGAD